MAISQTEIIELKRLLLRRKPQELVAWFSDKSSQDRSGLKKLLEEFRNDITNNWHKKKSHEVRIRDELVELGLTAKQAKDVYYKFDYHSPPFCLLDFATLTTNELKKFNFVLTDRDQGAWGKSQAWDEAYIQVLIDRNLKNINGIVASLLRDYERDGGGYVTIDFILLAVERGLIKTPDSDDYLVCLSDAFNSNFNGAARLSKNKAALKKNSSFLTKDVYRLLQAETDLLCSHAKADFSKFCFSLIKSKLVDRAKVLESVVRSMFLDSKKNVLQGAVKFLSELKPTPNELHVLKQDFIGLLESPQSFVTKFAFESLKTLNEKKKVDDEDFLKSVGGVFRCPTKGICKNAVALIKKICKANSSLTPHAIDAMLIALKHEEAEIQKIALAWITSAKDRLHPEHLSAIADSVAELAPSNRAAAEKLCSFDSMEESAKGSATKTQLDSIGNETSAGLRATNSSSFDIANYRPIIPIEDHEALIDSIAKCLEVTESGIEAERLMDGISRLGPVPESLQQQAAPVLETAVAKHPCSRGSDGFSGISTAADATPRMRRVICLALGMKELVESPPDFADEEEARDFGYQWPLQPTPMQLPDYEPRSFKKTDGPGYIQRALGYPWRSRLFWQRLEAIENNLIAEKYLPLLATPTHEHGWILPDTFVDRVVQWEMAGRIPDDADLILGLMRLAPVDRRSALAMCGSGLSSASKQLLTIALDGSLKKLGKLELDEAILNVAAHVRQKEVTDSEAKTLGIDPPFANRKFPMLRSWYVNPEKSAKNRRAWEIEDLVVQVEIPAWIQSHRVLKELYRFEYKDLSYHSRWRTTMDAWDDPMCRDAFWIEAMVRMLRRSEDGPANYVPSSSFLEALFDPAYIWEATACGATAVSLMAKDTDASSVAIDALIEAIANGRVDSATMGDALVRVFKSPLTKLKRFASNYSTVAEESPAHLEFAANSLDVVVREWAERRNKDRKILYDRLEKATECGPLLDLYLESLIGSGLLPGKETIAALEQTKTKATVAKKIQSILKL